MTSETDRALARLHLDLAHALYAQREALGVSVEALADKTGMPAKRVVMIEEGDTSSLTDVARLCHALHAELRLDADLGFQFIPRRDAGYRWTADSDETDAKTATFARSTA